LESTAVLYRQWHHALPDVHCYDMIAKATHGSTLMQLLQHLLVYSVYTHCLVLFCAADLQCAVSHDWQGLSWHGKASTVAEHCYQNHDSQAFNSCMQTVTACAVAHTLSQMHHDHKAIQRHSILKHRLWALRHIGSCATELKQVVSCPLLPTCRS
jgi:hypothetical protein